MYMHTPLGPQHSGKQKGARSTCQPSTLVCFLQRAPKAHMQQRATVLQLCFASCTSGGALNIMEVSGFSRIHGIMWVMHNLMSLQVA